MDAEEDDVQQVTNMVSGRNVSHYWEDSGIIGNRFQDTLKIDVYAWDVWMIYKPGKLWNDELPPAPDFWMHNLWGVKNGLRLNSREFAAEVNKYLAPL